MAPRPASGFLFSVHTLLPTPLQLWPGRGCQCLSPGCGTLKLYGLGGCLLACAAGRGPQNRGVCTSKLPGPGTTPGSCHLSVLATGMVPSLGNTLLRLLEKCMSDADIHKPPCWPAKGQPLSPEGALNTRIGHLSGEARLYGLPSRLWERLVGSGFWVHHALVLTAPKSLNQEKKVCEEHLPWDGNPILQHVGAHGS